MVDKIVNIRLKAIDEFSQVMNRAKKSMNVLGKTMTGAVNRSMMGTNRATAGWVSFGDTVKNKGILSIEKAKGSAKSFSQVVSTSMRKALSGAAHDTKRLRGNLLGAGLGMLFLGMAIQRYSMNMLKSLFKTYSTIMGEGTRFHEQTNSLSAAFEFLKFSIMDALGNSEMFASLVEWIITIVNAVSRFMALHPVLGKFIVGFLILGVIIGSIMLIYGQFFILARLMILSHTDLMGGATKNIAANWGKMITWMHTRWVMFTNLSGAAAIVWAIALVAVFALIFTNWAHKVGGFGNFWKGIFVGMGGILWAFVDVVMIAGRVMADRLLKPLNDLIKVYNTLAGVLGLSKIAEISFSKLTESSEWSQSRAYFQAAGESDTFGPVMEAWEGIDLNPFTDWDEILAGDFGEGGAYTPEGYTPPEEMTNIMNNAFEVNLSVEGLSPEAQQNLTDAVIQQLEEEGFLTGGSPQT